MRNRVVLLIALALPIFAQTSRVRFVGCKSTGQAEDVDAPKDADESMPVRASAAKRLAYYKASIAPGVLAPRGWNCVGSYGSSGSVLYVTPEPIKWPQSEILGPLIEIDDTSVENGSGAFEIAEVLARVFPKQKAFVQPTIEGLDAPSIKFGPFPKDRLIVQSDRMAEFRTPPQAEGLGTINWVKPNNNPIDGIALLEGQPVQGLLMLRVRLPRELRDLTPVIIHDLLVRQSRDAR